MQTSSFYVFRTKNIRPPSQERISSDWKTYVLHTKDIKQRLLETDSYLSKKHNLIELSEEMNENKIEA